MDINQVSLDLTAAGIAVVTGSLLLASGMALVTLVPVTMIFIGSTLYSAKRLWNISADVCSTIKSKFDEKRQLKPNAA